ncbi:MAG: 2-keto-3-deoxy-L-rhamnonate aldolase [Candidatus Moanabacter tarae]|uniref:2-keto-3-deoxy-L-rhamnonate aldolase n=1 Tax=Candidatus Moanibacter tarae TaxID=2200854 RepID=A0A2Z4AFJ0_9BACT|nr:MAG: 2-keto-3-deoxy-L-rhamnonate aldolase [Candidatus Moanabacter tarae]|tara:strand:+ start:326 stop:1066 length:741 start_codon:yes stop_codon:yes gene_type:complete
MHGIETLKKRIHEGELVIGVSVPLFTKVEHLKEIWEYDDYGFVSTDSQHGAFNEERLVEFCNAAEGFGIPVIFRIKHTYLTFLVGNLLDLGPSGIEVPQVEEETTVEEAVNYFYYPQIGKRSWGGAARVGVGERSDRLEYSNWWNNRGVLWMQIESLRSVAGAHRLVKEGVDCLSWGPADLSFDREGNPQHPLKTDDDCVAHTVKLLDGTGTRLMVRSYDPDLREKYKDMGVTVLLEAPPTNLHLK